MIVSQDVVFFCKKCETDVSSGTVMLGALHTTPLLVKCTDFSSERTGWISQNLMENRTTATIS